MPFVGKRMAIDFLQLASSMDCDHPLVLAATIMHTKMSMAAAKRNGSMVHESLRGLN